jgi:transposase InsO family protein
MERISSWKVQRVIEKHKLYHHPQKTAKIRRKRQRSQKKKRITQLQKKRYPGFLICLDMIVIYWNGLKRYIFTAIDYVSKVAFARMYKTKSSYNARDFLKRLYLLLDARIFNAGHDNGSEFQKWFARECQKLNISQWHSRPRTPKDNSVNEKFNQTLQQEFLDLGNFTPDVNIFNRELTEWLIEYNFKRPHQALNYQTPIQFTEKTLKVLPMWSSSAFS